MQYVSNGSYRGRGPCVTRTDFSPRLCSGARLIRVSLTGLFVFSHPPLPFDSQISDLI